MAYNAITKFWQAILCSCPFKVLQVFLQLYATGSVLTLLSWKHKLKFRQNDRCINLCSRWNKQPSRPTGADHISWHTCFASEKFSDRPKSSRIPSRWRSTCALVPWMDCKNRREDMNFLRLVGLRPNPSISQRLHHRWDLSNLQTEVRLGANNGVRRRACDCLPIKRIINLCYLLYNWYTLVL